MKKLFQKKEKTDYYIITPKKPSSSSSKSHHTHPGTPPITPSPPTSPMNTNIPNSYNNHNENIATKNNTHNSTSSSSTHEYYIQKLYQEQLANILSTARSTLALPPPPPSSQPPDDTEQNFIIASILGCGSDTSYLTNSTTTTTSSTSSSNRQYHHPSNPPTSSSINVPSLMRESQKDGLGTILEEGIAMWGMAPSEDSDEESLVDPNFRKNGEDGAFECVLQENEDGKSDALDTSNRGVMVDGGQDGKRGYEYCQPCFQEDNSNINNKNRSSALPSQQKLSGSTDSKDGKKKKKNVMVRSLSNLTNRSNKNSKRRQNNEGGDNKKPILKLFHPNKSKSNKANTTTKSKKGKWKFARDETTNRVYYYHTLTRQVSWEKPPSFQEWKVTLDQNSHRYYYYNVITKETTWVRPNNFKFWNKVEDEVNGAYYYNVLTKETRWDNPDEIVVDNFMRNSIVPQQQKQLDDITAEKKRLEQEIGITSMKDSSLFSSREVESDKPNTTDANVIVLQPREEISEEISEDVFEDVNAEVNQTNDEEPGKIVRTSDHDILKRLLMEHCPEETELNFQLLSKAHGRENLIVKGLENLIAETPYDALRLTIFSFVKETLRGMGEQPYDEVSNLQKKSMIASGVVPISSRSYSMNNKMLSTMTGVSTISHTTQAVNNTTAARLNDQSLPYSIISGKSNVSTATQQIKNTANGKDFMKQSSRPDRNDLLTSLELGEKDSVGYSLGELTETEEEDLTMNREPVISNIKSMELSNDRISDDELLYGRSKNQSSGKSNSDARDKHTNMTKDDESAYAADNDGISGDDYSYGDQALDDISALSEESPGRRRKKKGRKKAGDKKTKSKKEKKKSGEERRKVSKKLDDDSNFFNIMVLTSPPLSSGWASGGSISLEN
jgi:hypothetical protein